MRDPKQVVYRRVVLAGAGTVGALAAAAALLPGPQSVVPAAGDGAAKPAPETATGYRLTEHVKRYYASAKI